MRQLKWLSLLGLLLLPASSLAQSVRYQSQAISSRGAGIANATIAVCSQPAVTTTQPCSPLATLATSTSTTSGGANPLTADSFGNFFFYAAPGRYTVQIFGPAVFGQFVIPDVEVASTAGGSSAAFSSLTVSGAGTLSGSATVTNPCTLGGFIYVSTGGCYTTIPQAIAAFTGGNCGTIYLPVGTFTTNFIINSSNACSNPSSQMIIQGSGRRSTILKPSSNAAVITLDSTGGAIQSVTIRDIGFDNTATGFTQPAILQQGTNINDLHVLSRLYMNGFKDSLQITGRAIQDVYDNIEITNDTDIGVDVVGSTSAVNLNMFSKIKIINAAGAEGFLLSCTGSCGGQSAYVKNILENVDIEQGTGGGLVLNNTDGTTVSNNYYETNAGVQITATGSLTRGLVIRDSYIHTSNNTILISVSSTQISGEISGNFLANSGAGASTISIGGGSGNGIFVHGNYEPNSGPHTNTADGNGTFHMNYLGAYASVDFTASGSQAPTVTGINHIHYTNSVAVTYTNFVGGDPGQILTVFNEGTSTVTFTHSNTNGPFMPGGASVTIANGGSCQFVFEPLNGRWIGYGCVSGQSIGNAFGANTLTLKKGSGAGNYTNATTSYTVADSTNLCLTVTIPSGWKLSVSASGALSTATAAVVAQAALTDNAACSTANAGILVETAPIQGAAIGVADAFALNWTITGDGNAHNVALQFKTSNAADTASLINSSATITPTMNFALAPSN